MHDCILTINKRMLNMLIIISLLYIEIARIVEKKIYLGKKFI